MKTFVLIEFTHENPVPDLAEKAAGRAYMIQGVDNAEVIGIYTENPVTTPDKTDKPVPCPWDDFTA